MRTVGLLWYHLGVSSVNAIWPAPTTFNEGQNYLTLSSNLTFIYVKSNSLDLWTPSHDLVRNVEEIQKYILNDHHQILVPDRGESLRSTIISSPSLKTLKLALGSDHPKSHIHSIAYETRKPTSSRDESYTIEIQESCEEAILTAKTSLGFLRGLQSFSQLIYTLPPLTVDGDSASNQQQTYAFTLVDDRVRYIRAPIFIEDKPSFQYRGLLLDTSRNFFPISDLIRTVNAMSWAKLNTFHWYVEA